MQLQTERAFTPPLLARMGGGSEPDPQNISHPSMTCFNQHSWAAVTEQISAHPVGGLRFSSFRYAVVQNNCTLCAWCVCLCLALHRHVVAVNSMATREGGRGGGGDKGTVFLHVA